MSSPKGGFSSLEARDLQTKIFKKIEKMQVLSKKLQKFVLLKN